MAVLNCFSTALSWIYSDVFFLPRSWTTSPTKVISYLHMNEGRQMPSILMGAPKKVVECFLDWKKKGDFLKGKTGGIGKERLFERVENIDTMYCRGWFGYYVPGQWLYINIYRLLTSDKDWQGTRLQGIPKISKK